MLHKRIRAWTRQVMYVSALVLLPAVLSACSPGSPPLLLFERPFSGKPADLQEVLGGNEFLLKAPNSGKQFILEITVDPASKRTRIFFGSDQQRIREEVFRGMVLRRGNLLLLQRPAEDEPAFADLEESAKWASVRVLQTTGNHLLGLRGLASQPQALARHLDSIGLDPDGAAGIAGRRKLSGHPVWLAKPGADVWEERFSRFLALKEPLAIIGRRQRTPQPSPEQRPEAPAAGQGKPVPPHTKGTVDTAVALENPSHGTQQPYAPPSAGAERKRGVYLYPNPTADTIHLQVVDIGAYRWEILNANGKRIRQATGHRPHQRLNLQDWEPGTYYLRFFAREEPFAETYSFRLDPEAAGEAQAPDGGLEGQRIDPEP